jgi:hypothetical protein
MNDVRDAVERVGQRFAPSDSGFEDLSRRRGRIRTKRRVAAGGVALLVAVGGTTVAVRAFVQTSPTPRSAINTGGTRSATSASAECPGPPADGSPLVTFASTSGTAGSLIEVSGAFQTGERFLQVWWNADEDRLPTWVAPPPWPASGPELRFEPAGPGPVEKVASIAGPGPNPDCSFWTTFEIPDVEAGTYTVLRVSGIVNSPDGSGYALFTGPITFEVTG